MRMMVEDVEAIEAESVDDAVGELGSEAVHGARRKEPLHAIEALGRGREPSVHLQLPSESRILDPSSVDADALPFLQRSERSHRRDELGLLRHPQPNHRELAVRRSEAEASHHSVQFHPLALRRGHRTQLPTPQKKPVNPSKRFALSRDASHVCPKVIRCARCSRGVLREPPRRPRRTSAGR